MLLVSRVWEQGLLGVATLLLARMLGVRDFAPVSVLFVLNSVAVTASDFGLGVALLGAPAGTTIRWRALHVVRLANLAIAVAAALVAVALTGSSRLIVVFGGLLWLASAESYVRKSAAIKLGRARRVATAEVVSTGLFFLAVGIGLLEPDVAVGATGAGLLGKQLVEVALLREWRAAFGADGDRPELRALWGSQVLAYVIANVDYLVVGIVLSPAAFSVYVLSFRVANVLPAQVASVVGRVSLVEFAASTDATVRQDSYDRYVRRLFGAGVLGGLLTVFAAPLLPLALGESWDPARWIVVLLAFGVPWRLTLGLAGAMAVAAGARGRLLAWECVRLATSVLAFYVAARAGLAELAAGVTIVSVIAVLALHEAAGAASGVRPWRRLLPAALVTVVLAVIGARLGAQPF